MDQQVLLRIVWMTVDKIDTWIIQVNALTAKRSLITKQSAAVYALLHRVILVFPFIMVMTDVEENRALEGQLWSLLPVHC